MEPYIGEIGMVAFNFAPRGWAFCNGQILPINQNQALFSLLGTTFGGNGVTTFALPDMRSRIPVHSGQGPGLSNYSLGETGGAEAVALTVAQLPRHSHAAQGGSGAGGSVGPAGQVWAGSTTNSTPYRSAGVPTATMIPGSITATGGGQTHENRQPYLVVNFIIALVGIFPSRE
ncbi:tail fiber protein [Singulisphaera sp. Ch08]|uniref:Tail fiber protein n=1 Tax=Singulisphaera sp. Ch08 TaxID=3120278 RepID=A0AAU7CSI3_9BACT